MKNGFSTTTPPLPPFTAVVGRVRNSLFLLKAFASGISTSTTGRSTFRHTPTYFVCGVMGIEIGHAARRPSVQVVTIAHESFAVAFVLMCIVMIVSHAQIVAYFVRNSLKIFHMKNRFIMFQSDMVSNKVRYKLLLTSSSKHHY